MSKVNVIVGIDGDIVVYSCGFAAQERGKNGKVVAEPVENALHNAKACIQKCRDTFNADNVVVYLSGTGNFREKILSPDGKGYKENRKDQPKPVHYAALREYLQRVWRAKVIDGQEADDALGIDGMTFRNDPFTDYVICTKDKDLNMIPGIHYNWWTDSVRCVTDTEADRFFWEQMLTGDRVDNITGIRGVGPKKANKILDDALRGFSGNLLTYNIKCYEAILKAYAEAGLDGEQLLATARMLWIRRKPNELWTPPSWEEVANEQ